MAPKLNEDAIDLLEVMIERVKSGEIAAVAIATVNKNGGIGGDISKGKNSVALWAALQYVANYFYERNIKDIGE